MQTFHCDRAPLGKSLRLTPQGYLDFVAPIARVGWLDYKNPDGTIRKEYVSAEVLKDSADSFKMKPVTNRHPAVGLVDSKNATQHQVGMTGHGVYFDGSFLWMTGTITDETAVNQVLSGEAKELSAGYIAKVSANGDGTFKQDSRIGNHVAIVSAGRAGSDVSFRFDSDRIEAWEGQRLPVVEEGFKLLINLDGTEFEVEDASLAVALTAYAAKTQKTENQNAALTARIDALEGEKTALALRLDNAVKEKPTQEHIAEAVKDILTAWSEVAPMLRADGVEFTPDYSLSASGVRRLYLEKKFPHLNLDGKSDDYLEGLWSGLDKTTKTASNKDHADSLFDSLNLDAKKDFEGMEPSMETSDAILKARKRRKDRVAANSNWSAS